MAVGIAVVGGFVYRGDAVPGLQGQYVFGDWSRAFTAPDSTLFAAEEAADGTRVLRELAITSKEHTE